MERQLELNWAAAAQRAAERLAEARAELWRLAARLDLSQRLTVARQAVLQTRARQRAQHVLLVLAQLALPGEEVQISHRELARKSGLSLRTVRRAVEELERLRLVVVSRAADRREGSADSPWPSEANHYRIDWPQILSCRGDGQIGHPPGQIDHPPGQIGHPSRARRLDQESSEIEISEPSARFGLGLGSEIRNSEKSKPCAEVTEAGAEAEPGREIFFGELREAARRPVSPLPPRSLERGVFVPLSGRHLRQPLAMVEWFRRQLGSPRPVLPGDEAHLLLVLAAAHFAGKPPPWYPIQRPVGWFASTISRGTWERALQRLDIAQAVLARMKQAAPGLLDCTGEEAWREQKALLLARAGCEGKAG